jgi:hypothetical protein
MAVSLLTAVLRMKIHASWIMAAVRAEIKKFNYVWKELSLRNLMLVITFLFQMLSEVKLCSILALFTLICF